MLELFGLEGIKSLNKYYISRNQEKFESISLITENNNSKKYPYCPILLGVSILDQIKTLEILKKINFQKIKYPILLLPFLNRCSNLIGKKILFKFENNTFILNFNVNILSNLKKKEFPSVAKKVEIIFLENKDSFTEKEWKKLYKLSENTFVEETESLKKGAAGAGLTDND